MSHAHGVPKHRQLPDKESKLFKELLVRFSQLPEEWLPSKMDKRGGRVDHGIANDSADTV
jgi:hypothetical protein